MSQKKILYGVCGIGSGHTHRQLPLIKNLAERHGIIIFGYGESLKFYTNNFNQHPNISVCEVSVPFYVGNNQGIDYEATKQLPANQKDHDSINKVAKQYVNETFGKPDLVISDYEPISAEIAYEHDTPLVTIDQQSKYLYGDFPVELGGCTYADEVARLKLFFPKASTRIACSFFNVKHKENGLEVMLLPPILKGSTKSLANDSGDTQDILVYLSAQQTFRQTYEEIETICSEFGDSTFHIFTSTRPEEQKVSNVIAYSHGDKNFMNILSRCRGIISTAGHTLLSEAMHLNIPVYALPLDIYEQQMNAFIIHQSGFGISTELLENNSVGIFLNNIEEYKENILNDEKVLLKGDGEQIIINYLNKNYLDK